MPAERVGASGAADYEGPPRGTFLVRGDKVRLCAKKSPFEKQLRTNCGAAVSQYFRGFQMAWLSRKTATLSLPGRARWGASGSLNPQSALAGPNTVRGAGSSGPGSESAVLTVRFRALGAFEPRQVRKEAALRSSSQVPRSGLARASGSGSSRGRRFDDGCAAGRYPPGATHGPWPAIRSTRIRVTNPGGGSGIGGNTVPGPT